MFPSASPINKRRRGGQPGNTNAYRHGFYARSFTPAENRALDSNVKGEFTDELALARVNANRLAEMLKDYRGMSVQDATSAFKALTGFLDAIQGLTRTRHYLYQNATTVEKALEELSTIPPEQD